MYWQICFNGMYQYFVLDGMYQQVFAGASYTAQAENLAGSILKLVFNGMYWCFVFIYLDDVPTMFCRFKIKTYFQGYIPIFQPMLQTRAYWIMPLGWREWFSMGSMLMRPNGPARSGLKTMPGWWEQFSVSEPWQNKRWKIKSPRYLRTTGVCVLGILIVPYNRPCLVFFWGKCNSSINSD